MTVTSLAEGARIAVVDDVPSEAENTRIGLEDAGLESEAVLLLDDPDVLVQSLLGEFDAVVCDHRLQGKVQYYGAEVVAKCTSRGLPAVLLTTFADPRDNAVIQTFRARIPKLLKRGSASAGLELKSALDYAVRETAGSYSNSRRPHRTVVRVTARHDDPPPTIEIFIPAWSTTQIVSLPQASLGEFRATAQVGQRFLADVNIYCESHLDLYADNFEPIPDVGFEELIGGTDD